MFVDTEEVDSVRGVFVDTEGSILYVVCSWIQRESILYVDL